MVVELRHVRWGQNGSLDVGHHSQLGGGCRGHPGMVVEVQGATWRSMWVLFSPSWVVTKGSGSDEHGWWWWEEEMVVGEREWPCLVTIIAKQTLFVTH